MNKKTLKTQIPNHSQMNNLFILNNINKPLSFPPPFRHRHEQFGFVVIHFFQCWNT